MFQPARGREAGERDSGLLGALLSCLGSLARCLCCLDPDMNSG